MKIKFKYFTDKLDLDTKTMKLVCIKARGKRVCGPDEINATLAIRDSINLSIADILIGDVESSNALCEEIVRRFNEFPEELKR